MNRVYLLTEQENHRLNKFSIGALEMNYLDKRNPVLPIIWSQFILGLDNYIFTEFYLPFLSHLNCESRPPTQYHEFINWADCPLRFGC